METCAESFERPLDVLLPCTVCERMMTHPRMLKCGHFSCRECLSHTVQQENVYLCHFCGEVTSANDVTVVSLVDDVIAMKTSPDSNRSQSIKCKERQSEFYCVGCKDAFCEACCKHHDDFPILKFHKWVDITEADRRRLVVDKNVYCDSHYGKVMELHCFDCGHM